jgi:Fe-S cluster biogenesis protein NfuA
MKGATKLAENTELRDKVQAALDQVRPSLQADGGDAELVDVVGTVAKVRLQGACSGCPMAAMTLQMGIERIIKSQVPEITAVENVTEE